MAPGLTWLGLAWSGLSSKNSGTGDKETILRGGTHMSATTTGHDEDEAGEARTTVLVTKLLDAVIVRPLNYPW